MTFAELKSQIALYMNRTDLTTQIPQFIALAEFVLARELNLREMETSVTGTATASYITLPADFGNVSRLTTTVGGTERNVDYIARPDLDYVGQGRYYSQENNKLRLFPYSATQAYKLYYIVNHAPLSDTATTNWLSIYAPDLYLYASCLEAAKYIRDDQQVSILASNVGLLIDTVRRYSERKALPMRGGLQIRAKPSLV